MFSVGDRIVYPMHGAGTIQGIEEMKILGQKKQYYIFKLPCNDMNIMMPVESEEVVGVRDIVEKAEALVATANNNGGKDNIAVILIEPFADEVNK